MRKLTEENLWEILRTRSVAARILDSFPQVAGSLGSRMIYFYRDGRYRLKRDLLRVAVRGAQISATTAEERDQLPDLVEHFEHGPGHCELWAILDPEATALDVSTSWNDGCIEVTTRNGRGPNARFGDSRIPYWAEHMEDLEDRLGDSLPLFLLTESIVDLRVAASRFDPTTWMPISRRNMDFVSGFGDICKDKRKTALYVSSPRRYSDERATSVVEQLDFSSFYNAISDASDELKKFNVDPDQLTKAVYAAVEADARRVAGSYGLKH